MYQLTVTGRFEAAHQLNGYPGKCSRLHGHNWEVAVTFSGCELDHLGMLIDFKTAKTMVCKTLEQFDHYFLNEIFPFNDLSPTAENLARYVYEQMQSKLPLDGRVMIESVKVYESPNSSVLFREDK